MNHDYPIRVGDWFQVTHKKHFAYGQKHLCTGLPHVLVRGSGEVLDLGLNIQFTISDYWDKPAKHVVPLEWCAKCDRPDVSKRVKWAVKSCSNGNPPIKKSEA